MENASRVKEKEKKKARVEGYTEHHGNTTEVTTGSALSAWETQFCKDGNILARS